MQSVMHTSGQCKVSSHARQSAVAALVPAPVLSCSMRLSQAQKFGSASAPNRTSIQQPRLSTTRAAPAASQAPSSTAPKTQEWYALVASADFFFNDPQNESLAEQLRERVRFFKEQGKDRDFYFVPDPQWLEARYPNDAKKVKKPCVALVSTDKNWIVFMKLRLDRVLRFDLGVTPNTEVLAAGPKLNPSEFPGPAKWTAPYPRYSPGWWEVFYPSN